VPPVASMVGLDVDEEGPIAPGEQLHPADAGLVLDAVLGKQSRLELHGLLRDRDVRPVRPEDTNLAAMNGHPATGAERLMEVGRLVLGGRTRSRDTPTTRRGGGAVRLASTSSPADAVGCSVRLRRGTSNTERSRSRAY